MALMNTLLVLTETLQEYEVIMSAGTTSANVATHAMPIGTARVRVGLMTPEDLKRALSRKVLVRRLKVEGDKSSLIEVLVPASLVFS